jgi:hypothetical protein
MILSAPGTAAQERLSLAIPQILRLSEEIRPGWVALTSALTGLGPGNHGVSCRDLFTQCADGWRRTGPKRESGRARVRLAEEAVSAGSSCGGVRNGAWIRSTKSTSKKHNYYFEKNCKVHFRHFISQNVYFHQNHPSKFHNRFFP